MVLIELRVIAVNKKANKEEIEIRTAHLKTSQVTVVKYTFEGNPRFRLYFLSGFSSLSF